MVQIKQFMKTGSNTQNVHTSEFQNNLQIKSNLSISFCQSQIKKKHFALGHCVALAVIMPSCINLFYNA